MCLKTQFLLILKQSLHGIEHDLYFHIVWNKKQIMIPEIVITHIHTHEKVDTTNKETKHIHMLDSPLIVT